MLDALKFLCEFEAELVGFVIREPIRHLRKNDLMVAVRATVPGGFVLGGPGDREDCLKFQSNFFGIDLCRIGTSVFKPEAELLVPK